MRRTWKHLAGLAAVAAAAAAAHAHGGPPPMGGMQGGPGGGPGGGMQRPPMGGAMGGPMGGAGGGMQRPPQGGMPGGDRGGDTGGGRPQGPGGECPGPRGAELALMRAADADDSRSVSDEEWTAFLDGLAVDENGAVSLDDLASKLPAPPMGWPEDASVRDEGLTRALDADRDGVVTKDDLQAIRDRLAERRDENARPPRGPDPRGPALALMRAADADDSRSVSADEWAAFLDGLAADESGAVSLDDLASKLPAPPQGWPEDTAERDEHLTRAFDHDGDGVVTKDDLSAIRDRLDRDADGAAEPSELRPAKPLRGGAMRAAKAVARAADADDSRSVTAVEWAEFLEGLALDDDGAVSLDDLASKLPAPRRGWPEDASVRDRLLLRAFDADRDGSVTKADLQALFDGLDRNRDGALDRSDAPRRRNR